MRRYTNDIPDPLHNSRPVANMNGPTASSNPLPMIAPDFRHGP